ncbi:MAG: bifunctional YncE family protein/alkaline phosphatase family protein [Bacteroidales bacterium]|jgi:YVTN family beta-propeller protein|nr:bifunctional YncE family protein/alkaline phosphatase family protein [Bacteroidales bacterium]
MKNFVFPTLVIIHLLLATGCRSDKDEVVILSAPAGSLYTSIDTDGTTVIPNGRFLTPAGNNILVAPHPFGLALSPDGNIAVTANSGVNPLSISIIRNLASKPEVMQVPPGYITDAGVLESVFMGLAITPDNSKVYVAGGQNNSIFVFDLLTGKKTDSIDCSVSEDGKYFPDGYIGDMTITKDGNLIYAVDQTNFRLAIIDTRTMKVKRSVPVGRYPFGVALTPDEKKVYVANVGMFQYSKIGTIEADSDYEGALDFPPFGFNTEEMKNGIITDSLVIPGLGDPNSDMAFSVWAISVDNVDNPYITAKIKTGNLIGQKVDGIPAVGGSSPNSLAVTSRYVFVSNGNNDNITVIDITKDSVVKEISIKPDNAVKQFRGVIPFGLAVTPDEKKLFVAEAGINAIGVVDLKSLKVTGHIPTGWFPSRICVTPDSKKIIATNAKGYGSGPNGGVIFKEGGEGTYIGNLMKGTVSIINIPSEKELKKMTSRVIDNNFRKEKASLAIKGREKNPIPLYGRQKDTPIRHIVFISKENRTYDEVFGQVIQGEGDASIARYGHNASFNNRNNTLKVENATVMANHLMLASKFAIADNFYVDADVSADGHRWLVNTYPNEWVETSTAASYGGNRSYNPDLKAPGSLAMNGSAGAIYPEDYNESGSMWDHLERNNISFFNFGFSIMFEPAFYHESYKYTGIRQFANFPVPAPIFTRTSREYPTYNMSIPDQFRVSQFIREFNQRWMKGEEEMPQIITVIIPNDHGAGERPEAGYPFRESYMVDNDLAVGRIIEFLSHTPYWKNMAIFITEDDAQNGVDHIDAHRSILMVISPYAKRNYVSKVHYSFGSIFKTFWNLLGLPYLNQYDAAATDLADMFTDTPDFTPYNALPPDLRIFDPDQALSPLDEEFDWNSLTESPMLDDPEEMIKDQKEVPEYRLQDQKK